MSTESTRPRPLRWDWLGTVPYREAEALQHRIEAGVKARAGFRSRGGEPVEPLDDHLLLLEHPPVYTLGRNASEADVLVSAEWLGARGATVEECDRGGQVTFHGPGQLVGYPVLDLSPDRRDVRRYMHDLQEALIRTLADLGVPGRRKEGKGNLGVWVDLPQGSGGEGGDGDGDRNRSRDDGPREGKIASLGVHLSRWVTTHGFALNVTTDLDWFRRIVACGLPEVEMVSLASLGVEPPPLAELASTVAGHLGELFDRRPVRGLAI